MSTGCEVIEAALSARADNEDPGMEPEVLDAHVARCAGCRQFARRTDDLRRRMRVRPAPAVPDLSGRILAAIPEGPAPRGRFSAGRSVSGAGMALAGAAVAVVLVAAFLGGRVLAGGSSGGGSSAGGNRVASVQQVAGSTQVDSTYPGAVVLPVAYKKPNVTFTDTAGQPYNIAADTQGKVTLMYFGYTNCPDVCPINMSLTAQALAGMPAAQRQRVTVVFVTTDPTRDTPAVIRQWLNNFDPSFVGLRGTEAQIHEAEQQVGMELSQVQPGDTVTHAGYTLAYSQDNEAHLQIDVSETVRSYTATLEHLVSKGYQAS